MPALLLDTNLLLLLVVGRTDPAYVGTHKRTRDYDRADLETIEALVAAYDGLATTPHILAETSNLARQIGQPARDRIQATLGDLISECLEHSITGVAACDHEAFLALGLTDAGLLTLCRPSSAGAESIELLTADAPLHNRALSLGLPAELYA